MGIVPITDAMVLTSDLLLSNGDGSALSHFTLSPSNVNREVVDDQTVILDIRADNASASNYVRPPMVAIPIALDSLHAVWMRSIAWRRFRWPISDFYVAQYPSGDGQPQANCFAFEDGLGNTCGISILSRFPSWVEFHGYVGTPPVSFGSAKMMKLAVGRRTTGSLVDPACVVEPSGICHIRVAIRWLEGRSGYSASLDAVQPYIDWLNSLGGIEARSRKTLTGNAMGLLLADEAGDPSHRHYRAWGPPGQQIRPDQATGWGQMLNKIVDQFGGRSVFQQRNIKTLFLWTICGSTLDSNEFRNNAFTQQPTALLNSVSEVATWTAETGIEVVLYTGGTWHYNNPEGDWDTPAVDPIATGYYREQDLPYSSASAPESFTVKTDALGAWDANIGGAMVQFAGVALDASVDAATSSQWDSLLEMFCTEADGRLLFHETSRSDHNLRWGTAYQFDHGFYGRCHFLGRAFGDSMQVHQINAAYANIAVRAEMIRCGDVPIEVGNTSGLPTGTIAVDRDLVQLCDDADGLLRGVGKFGYRHAVDWGDGMYVPSIAAALDASGTPLDGSRQYHTERVARGASARL